MAALLGVLLIVSALTAPGFSLSCITCVDYTGAQCTGSSATCSAGSSCATSVSVSIVGSTTQSSTLTRGCAPANQCNITGSLSIQGGKIKISTSCCDSDSCNPTSPTLPADSTQANNLTCNTCATVTSDYCNSGTTIQCYGAETMCGRMSTYVSGSIRGCITPSVCNFLGTQQATYGSVNTAVKTFCSNGSVGLRGTFGLSTLMMLFLMKVLF